MDPGRSDRLLSKSLGASAGAESAGTSAGAAGASTGTPAGASSCYQHHRDYGDPQPSVLLDWWLQSFLCNFGWLGATTFLTPRWYRLLQLLQTIVIYGQRFVLVIGDTMLELGFASNAQIQHHKWTHLIATQFGTQSSSMAYVFEHLTFHHTLILFKVLEPPGQ